MFFNSIDNTHTINVDNLIVSGLNNGVLHSDTSGNISSSQIVNADVSNTAALSYSKLNLANSIVNNDIVTGTIADNKLSSTIDVNANANTIVKRSGSAGMAINGLSCGLINASDDYLQTKTASLNNWGARVMCANSVTGSDPKFIAGIYNTGGTTRVYFGANDVAQTQWLPIFIAPSGGARVGYDGSTNPTETLAVNGTSLFTGYSTFNNDILLGNAKFSTGTQTGSGTLNYTSNRFTMNNNGTVYELPNPININGTSQCKISCQEIVILRVAGNFALSTSSTTQGFTAASVSSNTPLEITINYSFTTAPLFGQVHCLFSTNTAVCYEAHFKNSIIGSNVTNIIKIYSAGMEVNTATFLDGDSFRLTVMLGGY